MQIANSILDLIGNTPLVKINRLNQINQTNIFAKLESFNPLGSVKDRIALAMIEEAEKSNKIKPGDLIIEPTSGNTGIGLAFVGAVKGYQVVLVMPENMSLERQKLLKLLGAKIFLTPATEGMNGAIKKAQQLQKENKNSYIPQQFENQANPEVHFRYTAQEIWRDTAGTIDAFVAGVGTGGTISGIAKFLKSKNSAIRIIAVEPATSAVISGDQAGIHNIQGIGAGFLPKVFARDLVDEVIKVTDEQAISVARELAIKEGILCGISGGAAMQATLLIAKRKQYKNIVTLLPDTGERYLSTKLFQENS